MRRFTRWALLVPLLLVLVVWYALWLHPAGRDDPWYARIALEIGVIAALCVLYQIVRTTGWTVRAMGVLGFVLGSASFYLLIGGNHWYPVTRGWHEGITDLAGAILGVAAPFLLWGLIATEINDRRERKRKTTDSDEPRTTGLP